MEIRHYLLLLRKWTWLLILGMILGGAGGYIYTTRQPVVYRTSTQIMVRAAQDQSVQSIYSAYFDNQLAGSYAQIINTIPVLNELSNELGYPIDADISVRQNTNTNVLVLTVTGSDPDQITEIANTLVSVFTEYNKGLQDENYNDTEESLRAQIDQVEEQMAELQLELSQITETSQESLKQQREEQAKEIEKLIADADKELFQIEMQLETFIPTPAVTNTPAQGWIFPTSTPVPVATSTLSSPDQLKYRELEVRREQLNQMRTLYQLAYADLLVLDQNTNSDPVQNQNQLQTTLALYQQIYANLLSSFENLRLSRLRSTPTILHVEPASVPTTPILPQPMRDIILFGVGGIILMGSIAFLIEYMDDTLKTPEDIARYLGLPVLGLIGGMGRRNGRDSKNGNGVYVADNPLSQIAEAFRNLRTNLDFAGLDKPIKLLQITSSGPNEGKSTIAANLAAVFAQGERSVILLDADLRRPVQHHILGISNKKGLIDLLRDPIEFDNVVTEWGTPTARAITTGELPPNPTELLASERMDKVLNDLKEKADIVIIDTAPTIITDPIVISAKVDGVLLVIEPGSTKIGAAQVMIEQLNRAEARIVGVVLNPISRKQSSYSTQYDYYYSGKYSRYSSENRRGKKKEN